MENFEWRSMMANEGKPERLDARTLKAKNHMQMEVMARMVSPDQGQAGIEDWVEHYAASFDTIFTDTRRQDSDFIDRWESSDIERDMTVDFFLGKLRDLEGPQVPEEHKEAA